MKIKKIHKKKQKTIQNLRKGGKIDTFSTQIYERSRSVLGTDTLIKSDRVKLYSMNRNLPF